MLVYLLLFTTLCRAERLTGNDEDEVDVLDFTDDFLKGSDVEVEEDPTGLPSWYGKIKTILNREIDPMRCSTRKIHDRFSGHGYFFSWEEPKSSRLELNWIEAREFCRSRCMDVISIESRPENEFIKQRLIRGNQKYMWTSGRKCNFIGCDRADLVPHDIYGWFWSGSLQRMPPTTNRLDSDWSDTGALGRPQPDNREHLQGGHEEDCVAILNNLYNDGVKWHDIACHHRKPFVCEDSEKLLEDVDYNNQEANEPRPVETPVHVSKPNVPTTAELTPVVAQTVLEHNPEIQHIPPHIQHRPSYVERLPL